MAERHVVDRWQQGAYPPALIIVLSRRLYASPAAHPPGMTCRSNRPTRHRVIAWSLQGSRLCVTPLEQGVGGDLFTRMHPSPSATLAFNPNRSNQPE